MKDKSKSAKIKKILLYILIAVGALGILDTVMLIPVTSSITLGMAFPGVFGAALIAFSVINLIKKRNFFRRKCLLRLIAIAFAFGALFFFTIEAFIWGEAHKNEAADTETNFVIVLGCGIFPDGSLTLTLKNRLDAAIEYLERYPDAVCVVSGGQGANEPMPEGVAMADYLISEGINKGRILCEDSATSTQENLLYSFSHMDREYPDKEKTVALVSSDFHLFRIKFLAKRYGMDAIGVPCETPWYIRPNCYIREFFGVIKSFFLDR